MDRKNVLLTLTILCMVAPSVAHAQGEPVEPLQNMSNKDAQKVAHERFGLYKIFLVGDASTNAYSKGSSNSFGGGLDFSTIKFNAALALRVGADEGSALADEAAFGRFLLTPEYFGKPSLDFQLQAFPWSNITNYESMIPSLGFQLYYRASETMWAIPTAGTEDPRYIRGNVNAVGVGVVGRWIPIATHPNHIEVQMGSNVALRIIGGDVALRKDVVGSQQALQIAFDDDDPARQYVGWEAFNASLRISAIKVRFGASWFPGRIDGFSGIQYTAGITLHEGPALTAISED